MINTENLKRLLELMKEQTKLLKDFPDEARVIQEQIRKVKGVKVECLD